MRNLPKCFVIALFLNPQRSVDPPETRSHYANGQQQRHYQELHQDIGEQYPVDERGRIVEVNEGKRHGQEAEIVGDTLPAWFPVCCHDAGNRITDGQQAKGGQGQDIHGCPSLRSVKEI